MGKPSVWALTGHRKGDNNQVVALAEALGGPVRTIALTYNKWLKYDRFFKGARLLSVEPGPRAELVPPWPDVVIGAGYRSVAAALWIKRQSGGRTLAVRIGNPRLSPRYFDLVISAPQYLTPDADNVLHQALAIGRPREPEGASAAERQFLDALPRPHRMVALGGDTAGWTLDEAALMAALDTLLRRCAGDGGTVLVIGSPRTDPGLLARVAAVGTKDARFVLVEGGMPRFAVLLDDADEIHVTGDSVSMLSEAIMAGKPVGMIPIAPTRRRFLWWVERQWRKRRGKLRDLRLVWAAMHRAGLVGTVDQPLSGPLVDPLREAADAVRALMRARGME